MVYPILPLFLSLKLGVSPVVIGLIEGIAESIASLLKVFSGYVSDRVGRRKPLAIIGYASSTVGKLFLFFARAWGHVLTGRIIDRLGKGIRTAPRDALIADSARPERKGQAFGLHRALDTVGAVVGVSLAYYFFITVKGNYTSVFLYSLIPAVLGVALLFIVREGTKIVRTAAPPRLSFRGLPFRLKAFLVIVFIFALGNSSNLFLLLRASKLGVNPATVILLYLAYNLVYLVFAYPAGRLSDRIGRKTLLVAGYLFYGLVYIGFALVKSPMYLWGLFGVYGVYIGLTEGVEKALVADIAPENLRATMIGLHATLVGIGLLPASLLAGVLWNLFGAQAPFFFGGGLGIVAAVCLAILI
jgi:MFS family permease